MQNLDDVATVLTNMMNQHLAEAERCRKALAAIGATPKATARKRAPQQKRAKGQPTQVDLALGILKQEGMELHVDEIMDQMPPEVKKTSLVSALLRAAKKEGAEIFKVEGKRNTFDLRRPIELTG